jgi:hypothetical protein
MLRTERITRPGAVQHEIDTYNESVPGTDELSCTLMIEIVDAAEREAFLRAAAGLESHVWLISADGERIQATSKARDGATPDRTTAVHYLKFALPSVLARAWREATAGGPSLELEVDHPAYRARVALSRETLHELAEDLRS